MAHPCVLKRHRLACVAVVAAGVGASMPGGWEGASARAEGADPLRIKMLQYGAKPDRPEQPQQAAPADDAASTDDAAALTDREMVQHVLARMTFGPRPGQAEQVLAMGWEAWARRQLNPDGIDDSELNAMIAERWPSLGMSMSQIFTTYRPPYENDPPTMEEQRRRNELHEQVRRELRESVLMRAVQADAQFREVICEFWRNHFNVDQQKDDVGFLANHYEQQAIRAHAFGRFEDMLLASAQHPAMLIYLDNIVSQKPLTDREVRLVTRFEGSNRKPRSVLALERQMGLNENYARELMELHTLGVDNGYTQRDVTEVARVLTGWTARGTAGTSGGGGDYGFYFNPEVHDDGDKRILGYTVRGDGVNEGLQIIRGLARDKRTARFIAHKLCAYLVQDDPPAALVDEVAAVFDKTNGHLPKVYEAILFSDAFKSRRSYRAKFRTPFEFVVASLRATDATIDDPNETLHALQRMGQPIYQQEDPTGYEDQAEAWLDPGVLVYRWAFALRLGQGQLSGVRLDDRFLERTANRQPEEMARALVAQLIPSGVDDETMRTLIDEVTQNPDPGYALSLVLGSPAFQQQ